MFSKKYGLFKRLLVMNELLMLIRPTVTCNKFKETIQLPDLQ